MHADSNYARRFNRCGGTHMARRAQPPGALQRRLNLRPTCQSESASLSPSQWRVFTDSTNLSHHIRASTRGFGCGRPTRPVRVICVPDNSDGSACLSYPRPQPNQSESAYPSQHVRARVGACPTRPARVIPSDCPSRPRGRARPARAALCRGSGGGRQRNHVTVTVTSRSWRKSVEIAVRKQSIRVLVASKEIEIER